MMRRTLLRALPALLLLWALTGVFLVRSDERAVVRRFGRVTAGNVPPGLHLTFPWLIARVDRLKVQEQKRLSVGFDLNDELTGRASTPSQREFLTGDQNLINVTVVLQYQIADPVRYLFAAEASTALLRQAAETALAEAVADSGVDSLLTTGKFAVQTRLRGSIQRLIDTYGLGLRLSSVNLAGVTPPAPVSDAFTDVANARADRDRLKQEAEAYANDLLPRARGEAEKIGAEARGYRVAVVQRARGDAERFRQAYAGYRTAPDVTRRRLYLETMEAILPNLNTIVVDENGRGAPVDLNLIPSRRRPPPAPSDEGGQ